MSTTVDHIGLNVADLAAARKFYAAALEPLGIVHMADYGTTFGMGEGYPFFWVSEGEPGHVHLAFRAESRAAVDAFHAAAVAAGGKDNGKPGLRTEYSADYYAAFVIDPDGHNIEAVTYAK